MTTFLCAQCNNATLQITQSISVPALNALSQDELLQTVACKACESKGIGFYRESSAGALDEESVDHEYYMLDTTSYQLLFERIAQAKTDDVVFENVAAQYKNRFVDTDIHIDWKQRFPMTLV